MSKLLSCLVAAALVAGGADAAQAADLSYPGPGVAPPATLPPLHDVVADGVDLGAVRDRAFAIADRFPAADFDLDAVATRFAGDPAGVFAYVRDLALDPYQGVLRGAAGVLAARGGSSADKALLLAELLRRMGIEARFAFGSLDAEALARLRAQAVAPRPQEPAAVELAGLAGLSPAALDRLAARAQRDFAWLWAAAGDRLAPQAEPQPAPRHVWVQALIDGAWVDLDPSLPGLAMGDRLAAPGATAEAIPDALLHQVRIAVVAEFLLDGRLAAETVLEQQLPAAEAAQDHIFLAFSPEGGGMGAAIGGAILQAFGAEQPGWLPVLAVGDTVVQGTALPALASGASSGNDAADFFFGGVDADVNAGPELAALYLDVTVMSPWTEPQTRRRVLFDRLDPAARTGSIVDPSALAPAEVVDGVPAPFAAVHQIAVSTGGASPHHIAVGVALAAEQIGAGTADAAARSGLSLPELLWPVGAVNAGLALASERLMIEALNDRDGLRFHIGAPRVFILSFRPVAAGGGTAFDFSLDLLHDGVAAVGDPAIPPMAVAERRMWYGVLQSALETTIAELRAAGFTAETREVVSTSIQMQPELAVIAPGDGAGVAAPGALAEALADGWLVVANAGAVGPALESWWTVDPRSGEARAIWAPGLGGSGWRGVRPGYNYVNASTGGNRIIVDERSGRVIGEVRNGRDYYYRQTPRGGTCRGGNEYSTILGCVSLPAGMAVGTAYALVISEVVLIAALIIIASAA